MIDWLPAGDVQLHRNTMELAISKFIDPHFPTHFLAEIVTIFKPNFIDYICLYFNTVDFFFDLFSTLIQAIRIITMSLVTAHSFKLVGEDAVDRCASCLCHVYMAIHDIRVNIFARNGRCDIGVIVAGTISM